MNDNIKDFTYESMPEIYRTPAPRGGSVHKTNYPSHRYGVKYAYVYTPYGYDNTDMHTRYDILYLMHGANSGAETFLWGEGLNSHFKNILDHMTANEEIRPLIVVTPGLYPPGDIKESKGREAELAEEFPEELINSLMPSVESMYLTYADTIDAAGFRASREHRGFAGFSMGAVVAWYVFAKHADMFSTFMPVCGDCWAKGRFGGENSPEETADWLSESFKEEPVLPGDFTIYMATGTEDMAFPGFTNQLGAMKKHSDVFRVPESSSHSPANLYHMTLKGGKHDYDYAYIYLRAALRSRFPALQR